MTFYIYPAISVPPMANLVADQFAFQPTGSTTAALIDLLNNTTELLQSNEYVILFSVDFSKDNRGHAARLSDAISLVAGINASIIQGSVVGSPSSKASKEPNMLMIHI